MDGRERGGGLDLGPLRLTGGSTGVMILRPKHAVGLDRPQGSSSDNTADQPQRRSKCALLRMKCSDRGGQTLWRVC